MPAVFNQARQVPGRNDLVVCLGSGHSPGNVGAILLVDRHKGKQSPEAMTALTPGSLPKGNWGLRQLRNGRWLIDVYGPWYCDPSPLADAAHDRAGRQVLPRFLQSGQALERLRPATASICSMFSATACRSTPIRTSPASRRGVFEPRPAPPAIPATRRPTGRTPNEATVVVSDVYQGLDGVAPGP